MSKLIIINRVLAFSIFGFAIFYQNVQPNPVRLMPIGHYMHLTYWDLLAQFSFFNFVLLMKSCFKINSYDRFISTFLYSICIPVGCFVTCLFWYLFVFQREFLLPPDLKPFYPWWHRHFTHTFVSIFALVELCLNQYKPPSKVLGLSILTIFMGAYATTVFSLGINHNVWPYPIFAILTWPQRIVFILLSHSLCVGFYFFGLWLNEVKKCQKTM